MIPVFSDLRSTSENDITGITLIKKNNIQDGGSAAPYTTYTAVVAKSGYTAHTASEQNGYYAYTIHIL